MGPSTYPNQVWTLYMSHCTRYTKHTLNILIHTAHNTRSYHTLVVDVYARCYIYRSRTEIFISCVCPTCSISLAERFYQTRSKIFISWVGVDLLYITSGAQRTRVIYNRSTPYPADKYFRPSPINPLSKWYRTGRTNTADKYFSPRPINAVQFRGLGRGTVQ